MRNLFAITDDKLFYRPLIAQIIDAPSFVPRPWLLKEIEKWLIQDTRRFLLLTGAPGSGKTALMAWLANNHDNPVVGDVWLRYFIRRDSKALMSSSDTRSFLFTVGHQLATLWPEIFHPEKLEVMVTQRIEKIDPIGKVTGIRIEDLQVSPFFQTALKVEQNVAIVAGTLEGISVRRLTLQPRLQEVTNLQYLALLDPAAALQNAEQCWEQKSRIVILIDALDELRYQPAVETILHWLEDCPDDMPSNLRIVVASRVDDVLLGQFKARQARHICELSMNLKPEEVRKDLYRSAARFVDQARVQDALADHHVDPELFKEIVVDKAAGNFQYLATVFRNLEVALDRHQPSEIEQALALQDLPSDLKSLYAFFLKRLRDGVRDERVEIAEADPLHRAYLPAWEGRYQPALGLLSVAKEPIGHQEIYAWGRTGLEERWSNGAIEHIIQFLKPERTGYLFYHASLPEFLTDSRTWESDPDCYLDPQEWHRKITAYYLDHYSRCWSECDAYGLQYLIDHILSTGLPSDCQAHMLSKILRKPYMEAIIEKFGWLDTFMDDLDLVAVQLPEAAGYVVRACTTVILTMEKPKSLIIQRALRLLVALRPKLDARATHFAQQLAIDAIVDILHQASANAAERIKAMLTDPANKKRNRVRSAILLALADTGDPTITDTLLEALKTEHMDVAWAAADALVTLNDRSVIPKLRAWYDRTSIVYHKERILYTLGRMVAPEAIEIKPSGLESQRAQNIGRAMDIMWLLPSQDGDVAYLRQHLRAILDSDPLHPALLGPWKNEWLQRRLVRVLTRLGVVEAMSEIGDLQAHVQRRTPSDTPERRGLIKAIKEAPIGMH